MYHPHFGLTKSLFHEGIALDTAVYSSTQYNRLIASFKVALASPSSVIVLTGPAGVGKTTLTSTALRATTTRLAIAWLDGTPTNASELLELLLIELGIATLRTTRIERLQLWRQFQSEMSATASRLFVVAERTADLSTDVLRSLDSLTSPDAAGNTGANVVLLGQPELEAHLGASSLDALRQRIRLKAQLDPFTEPELQDYLRHQVACAGGRFDAVFAPGVVAALYRQSGGVARLANNLCETALTLAATQLEKTLTIATLTSAAAMLGLPDTMPTPVIAAPAKPAAAMPAPERIEPAPRAEPNVATPPPAARAEMKPASSAAAAPAVARTPPVPPLAPSFAPIPASISAAPVTVTASVATPPPAPALSTPPPPVRAPVPAIAFEFDGGATDLPDVASSEFPVLTDAVEMRPHVAATPTPVVAKPAATPPPAAATPRPTSTTPPPPRPAPATTASQAATPAPAKRLETAYSTPKVATPPKPATPAAAAAPQPAAPVPNVLPAAAKQATAAAPSAPPKPAPDDEDVLRQTQTMRAISVAKSIDDVSDSMAETLFGDAELDLMTAALASSANWDDDTPGVAPSKPESSVPPQKPAAAPPKAAPTPKPAAAAPTKPKLPESDDLLDLLGLSDAPLELIDDSTLPPTAPSHKTAAQR